MVKRANGSGPGTPAKRTKKSLGSLKRGVKGARKGRGDGTYSRHIAKNDYRNYIGKVREKLTFSVRDAPATDQSDRLFDLEEVDGEFHGLLLSLPLEVKYAHTWGMGKMTHPTNSEYNKHPEGSTYSLALWLDPDLPDELRDRPWADDYDRKATELADFLEKEYQEFLIEAIVDDPKAQVNHKKGFFAGMTREEQIEALRKTMTIKESLKVFRDEQTGRRYIHLTCKAFKTKTRGEKPPSFDEKLRETLDKDPRARIAYCKERGYEPKFINLRHQPRANGPWEVVPKIHDKQLDQEIIYPGNYVMPTIRGQVTSYKLGCSAKYAFFPDICMVDQFRRERNFDVSDYGGGASTFSYDKATEDLPVPSEDEEEEEVKQEDEDEDAEMEDTQTVDDEEADDDEEVDDDEEDDDEEEELSE